MTAPAPGAGGVSVTMSLAILALDSGGQPKGWMTPETAVCQYARGHVVWSLGQVILTFRGGIQRKSGERSVIEVASIIACEGEHKHSTWSPVSALPGRDNRLLFSRDRHLCAYCGDLFAEAELTRDHIVPRSQGGRDTWENCVTACRRCNLDKAGRTPEQAGLRLLYVPYRPVKSEKLILANRHILADQMEYLQALARNAKTLMRAA